MWMPPLYRDFTTPAQIDAEYGTQQRVADPAAEARHYVERSRDARERLRCVLDQPFGPTLDETLDIFPADRPGAPVFVLQRRAVPSSQPVSRASPAGLNSADSTAAECSNGWVNGSPVKEFHTRAVRSSETVATHCPFALKIAAFTFPSW